MKSCMACHPKLDAQETSWGLQIINSTFQPTAWRQINRFLQYSAGIQARITEHRISGT
jgi:hypothetical protein